jgi:hypothetical protein
MKRSLPGLGAGFVQGGAGGVIKVQIRKGKDRKMSDHEFSENMVVCAVGYLSPGNISDSCESCPHNKSSFPGVLIAGVTKDAVMLLSEKVEIVPEGTKARMEEMAAANGKMRRQIEGLQKNVLEFFDSTNATVAAGEKISIDYAHLKNRVSELEASNAELLEALEAAKQFIQNGIQYGYINMPDKDCGDSAIETPAKIEAAIQKAREQG